MPARLVICPVDETVDSDGTLHRRPRVGNIPDPGRPPVVDPDSGILITPKYVFVAAINGGPLCFCLVAGVDMSGLDADPTVRSLFDTSDDQPLNSHRVWLENTPRSLGWGQGKIRRVKGRMEGAGNANFGLDTSLAQYCNRVGKLYSPTFDILKCKTTCRGA